MPLVKAQESLLQMPRTAKRLLALTVDACVCVLTVWLALCLRLEQWVYIEGAYWWPVLGSVLMALPLFARLGLYRALFRYASWHATQAVVQAVGLYALFYCLVFTVIGMPGVPRTVGVVQPLLLLVSVGLVRGVGHFWLSGQYLRLLNSRQWPGVLIYGAGNAGRQLMAALRHANEHRLLGFLDDNPSLQGSSVNGYAVYSPDRLQGLIDALGVTDVLLAMPEAGAARRREIIERLSALHAQVHVRIMPSLADLANGHVSLSDARELDIGDLLGREPVPPDELLLRRDIQGKVVMVTGAGGSIGSELCRQILASKPATLLLVELNEYALYQIHQELEGAACELIPLLASVQDEGRMAEIMAAWRPHTLYHAAAYKHVPLVEHNPAQGVLNNVWGTLVCARAAISHGVGQFVLISTDKAVRPTNIMGASKRLAEMVLQALAQPPHCGKTCFAMVRFGNVLGSSGSVVPLFREQIRSGGPITLTHPDITRYFMTIPEAAQLVIQAGAMAAGGEVYVLDMGEPVRIIDLARRMVELSGLTVKADLNPDGDIEIRTTGLRPGEKLYEELLIGGNPMSTSHPRIMKADEVCLTWPQLDQALGRLREVLAANDVPSIRSQLSALVKGFSPADCVVDWVWKQKLKASGAPPVQAYGLAGEPVMRSAPIGGVMNHL